MALGGPSTQNYFDGDGLFRKYGPDKAISNRAGEFKTYGDVRELEVKVVFGNASAFGSQSVSPSITTDFIQSDQVFFPKGVFVEEVQVEGLETVNNATSISIGMCQNDDRTTLIGANGAGFVSALVVASTTPGTRSTMTTGSTSAGSLIGTVAIAASAAFTGLITARWTGGSMPTTGAVLVRIKYRVNNP